MSEKKQSKFVWKLFLLAFIIVFIIAGVAYGYNKYRQKKTEDAYKMLASQETQSDPVPEQETGREPEVSEPKDKLAELGVEIPERNIDFDALKEENEDIYAWLYIPGVEIDYPILQHPTDDAYYLDHNLDGSSGLPGVIYTETVNQKDFTDPHTVIYGHNMNNGTMFGALHKYEDRQVFDENQFIYIYTPEKVFVYQIFAAYEYNAVHLIYNFDLDNPEIFQNYLEQIFETRSMNANIRQDAEVDSDHRIVTLSTCVRGKKNMRYLVQGVLLNDE